MSAIAEHSKNRQRFMDAFKGVKTHHAAAVMNIATDGD